MKVGTHLISVGFVGDLFYIITALQTRSARPERCLMLPAIHMENKTYSLAEDKVIEVFRSAGVFSKPETEKDVYDRVMGLQETINFEIMLNAIKNWYQSDGGNKDTFESMVHGRLIEKQTIRCQGCQDLVILPCQMILDVFRDKPYCLNNESCRIKYLLRKNS